MSDSTKGSYRADAWSGGRWAAIRNIAFQVINLGTTAVLTRLLVPQEFGRAAAALVIIGGFQVFSDLGFGAVLVQTQSDSRRLESSLFWVASALGISFVGVAFIAANPLTSLMGQRDVTQLVRLGALALALNVVASVPRAILYRSLAFRSSSLLAVGGLLVYAISASSLAIVGTGALAVIGAKVIQALFTVVATPAVARWRPTLALDLVEIRRHLGFNAGWFASGIASYFRNNLDYWYVGRVLGQGALGIYYVSFVVPDLVRSRISSIANEVLFPIFSRFSTDIVRIRRSYVETVEMVGFVAFPALAGVAAVAPVAVPLMFGDNWLEAVSPMRWLCLAAATSAVVSPAFSVHPAVGKPLRNLVMTGAAVAPLLAALMWAAPRASLEVVAAAVGLAWVAGGLFAHWYTMRMLAGSIAELARRLIPLGVASIAMGLVVQVAAGFLGLGVGALLLLILAGLVSYGGFGFLLLGRRFLRLFANAGILAGVTRHKV